MIETQRFLDLKEEIKAALARGDFETALSAADSAFDEARSTGDDETVDLAVCNRAAVRIEMNDGEEELPKLRPILLRSTNPVVGFAAAYSTARIYQERRDFKKALFYAKKARDCSNGLGDHPGSGHALNQLGTLYLCESRIPDAIDAFERSRSIFDGIEPKDRLALAFIDENLGYCYFLEGRHADGFRHCRQSLATLDSLGAETYSARPHLFLCFGHLECQELEAAIAQGELAVDLSRRHGVADVHRNALYLLDESYHLSGDDEGAGNCFDELARLYPEVRYLKDFLFAVDLKKVINLRL